MRVLITGGTGFIGSHLVEACLERKDQVTCLVRTSSDTAWLQTQDVRIEVVDFLSIHELQEAVEGVAVVFHLAGAIYAASWGRYHEINCRITENLLEACVRSRSTVTRFVFVSSISATGPGKRGEVLDEDTPCRPVSDYGKSKLMAEEIVLAFKARLPVVIVRPANTIGPRQSELLSSIKLIRNRIIPSIGNGDTQTSICYVTDLIVALLLAGESTAAIGNTYLVAGNGPYCWQEVVESIRKSLGIHGVCLRIPFGVQYVAAFLSELMVIFTRRPPLVSRENLVASRDLYWVYDESRIRAELGFMPVVGLEEGISRTIAWCRQNQLIS